MAGEPGASRQWKKRKLNEGRKGAIEPIPVRDDRRFSGFLIARLLGWPLTDDLRDYMPEITEVSRQA